MTQTLIDNVISEIPNCDSLVYYDCACGNNAIVNVFLKNELQCIGTDLFTQDVKVDYLNDELPEHDFIVTNPPFSLGTKFLKKLYESGKPFILLLPVVNVSRKAKHLLFHEYGVIMYCTFPRGPFLREGKQVQVDECAWFYGNSGKVSKGEIVVKSIGLF